MGNLDAGPLLKVFLNAGVITDSGVIADGMVVVCGDRIQYAGERSEIPAGAQIVDVGGLFLAPGFVDIHIHGGAGSDFMDGTDADIESVFRYHAAHGTTSLCPTTATAPLAEILLALEALERYRTGPQAAGRALGAHIEGPYLAMTKRGCHLPRFVRHPEEHEWRQILERGPIASMTLAPELPGARALVEELHRRGAEC